MRRANSCALNKNKDLTTTVARAASFAVLKARSCFPHQQGLYSVTVLSHERTWGTTKLTPSPVATTLYATTPLLVTAISRPVLLTNAICWHVSCKTTLPTSSVSLPPW